MSSDKRRLPRACAVALTGFAVFAVCWIGGRAWGGSAGGEIGPGPAQEVLTTGPRVAPTEDAVELARLREQVHTAITPEVSGATSATSSTAPQESQSEQLQGLLQQLLEKPTAIEAETLGQYTELNPAGVALRPDVVAGLAMVHQQCVVPLGRMLQLMPRLQHEELNDCARRGLLRALAMSKAPEIQQLVEAARAQNRVSRIDAEPMFRGSQFYEDAQGLELFVRIDGVVFGAAKADLRESAVRSKAYVQDVLSAYRLLLTCSLAWGLQSADEYQAKVFEAEAWAKTVPL